MLATTALMVALAISQAAAEPTGRLAGRVTVEGTNAPIASARVMLLPTAMPTGPFGPPPQGTTDRDGRFAFDRVAPGEYHLQVQKSGYAPVSDTNLGRTVRVAAGQAVDVELHLQKGAAISGRVLDANGEPVAEVRIMAMRRPPERAAAAGAPRLIPAFGGSQQTNDLGEFRLSGLPPGEYLIAAMPMGFAAFGAPGMPLPAATARASRPQTTTTATYYPGTIDEAAALPVAVTAGAEVGNIVFTMQSAPAYRVSGVVVDENGSPVAGAMVMLMSDPRAGMMMGPAGSARSEAGGRFVIDGVVSGSYRATASTPIVTGGMPVTGGVVGGVVGGLVNGGITTTWSVGGGAAAMPQQTDVVVGDANVSGVRVVVRRPS